jgi:hypothetical protein
MDRPPDATDVMRVTTTAPDPTTRRRRVAAMPASAEDLLPWLSAAFVMAALNLAAAVWGVRLTLEGWAILLLGLVATIVAAGLVAARGRRDNDAATAEERARPAGELLESAPATFAGPGYVSGMASWTTALLELVDHAMTVAPKGHVQETLTIAREDTQALQELLVASEHQEVSLNDAATLHAVCSLWETDQERVERLAAQVDLAWHRRWRARSIVARQLRHGRPDADRLVLPYR